MTDRDQLFLRSALTLRSAVTPLADIMPWFWSRQQAHRYKIEQIPFAEMDRWRIEEDTGNIVHDSGKFFSIEAINVKTNYGPRPEWRQPVINQPEIGILGIIAKQIDGVLHFLMQVKLEPGNINMVQLSPTLQATRSNYTGVHKGKTPPYLEYFFNLKEHRVLIDSLQSEQGGRFLRKRNRNIIIEVADELPVYPDFRWMTLGQIHQLLFLDNIVNMDTRTVLGCIPFGGSVERDGSLSPFRQQLLGSVLAEEGALHSMNHLCSWFTQQKFRYDLEVARIPLNQAEEWVMTDSEISHCRNNYFSVIACRVEAQSREVSAWTQPLIKTQEPGLAAFICQQINGVLHFLVQAKVEPGIFDILELAPTVQCTTGNYRLGPAEHRAPFLDYVLNAPAEQVLFDVHLSEEGGRFFREANRNMIIEAGSDFPLDVPENYAWATLCQLKAFVNFNNHLNVECRCLMSCFALLDPVEDVQ